MAISQATISRIHQSGHQMVLAITGGAASAIGALLAVPGGSHSILEAVVPYSWPALVQWLGGKPDQACAPETARAMAMAAWCRARQLADGDVPLENLLGVGCTASLASDRPKRGPHRAHLAFQTLERTRTCSIEMEKGARTRASEDSLASDWLIDQLAQVLGIQTVDPPRVDAKDKMASEDDIAPAVWQRLLRGDVQCVGNPDFEELVAKGRFAIFPGSFNPLHVGHEQMAAVAAARLAMPVVLELSILNVDKPPLNYTDLKQRTTPLAQTWPCVLTRAPTFVEKAILFPGKTFIVGADTIVRIGDPRYYGSDTSKRDQAIEAIARCHCRFLVFGRTAENAFQTLADLEIPNTLRRLCDEIPATQFHNDISSSELRRGG